jgi:prepilin-type processing-associated H-X9-DG protein
MCKSYMMYGFGSFICPDDSGTTPFSPLLHETTPYAWKAVYWDFGPEPAKHLSYAYHMPYGAYRLTTSSDPGMAVMADRNPWLDAPGYPARSKTDFASFNPNGTKKLVRRGNTIPHKGKGQNVLFVDGHVAFEKTPNCGLNGDNIYTSHNGTDIQRGIPPTRQSQPTDPNDSLLVHDPPIGADR